MRRLEPACSPPAVPVDESKVQESVHSGWCAAATRNGYRLRPGKERSGCPRHVDLHRPGFSDDGLGAVPLREFPLPGPDTSCFAVSQVLVHLCFQSGLQDLVSTTRLGLRALCPAPWPGPEATARTGGGFHEGRPGPGDRDGGHRRPSRAQARAAKTDRDEIVLSLSAKGFTPREIAAQFGDVFGVRDSKDAIWRRIELIRLAKGTVSLSPAR